MQWETILIVVVQQLEFIKVASSAQKSQTTEALKCQAHKSTLLLSHCYYVMRYVLSSLPKIAVKMRCNELLVTWSRPKHSSPVIWLHPSQFRVGYGNKSNTARTFAIIEINIYSVQDPCWQGVIFWTTLADCQCWLQSILVLFPWQLLHLVVMSLCVTASKKTFIVIIPNFQ